MMCYLAWYVSMACSASKSMRRMQWRPQTSQSGAPGLYSSGKKIYCCISPDLKGGQQILLIWLCTGTEIWGGGRQIGWWIIKVDRIWTFLTPRHKHNRKSNILPAFFSPERSKVIRIGRISPPTPIIFESRAGGNSDCLIRREIRGSGSHHKGVPGYRRLCLNQSGAPVQTQPSIPWVKLHTDKKI